MAHTSRAWVMEVADGWRVAAGASQVVEYLLAPATIDVPRTPKHCAGLLIWRDRMIPVIDFAPLQTERKATTPWMEEVDRVGNERSTIAVARGVLPSATLVPPRTAETRRAVILAWQDAPAQPVRYGALLVTAAPTEVWVSDDMAGPQAQMPEAFRHVARACFLQQDQAIPILDARQLFSRPLPRLPAPASAAAPGAALPPPSMESDEVDEPGIHHVESTLALRLEPAVGELPRSHSIAENTQVWTSPGMDEVDRVGNERSRPRQEQAVDESRDGRGRPRREQAVEEAVAAAYCVVLPFPPSRSADTAPASAESVCLVEARDLPESVPAETGAPAETQTLATFDEAWRTAPMDGGKNAASAGGAAPAVAVQQAPSHTLQSFQRLHAIEQAIEGRGLPRPSMGSRWRLLAGAVGLAMLAGALFVFMDFSARAPAPAKESAARDVAPGGINPASVPSTPAQPPK